MTKQITIEEALKLVSFRYNAHGEWEIGDVHGDVINIEGNVTGFIHGRVSGNIYGHIYGSVRGSVFGTVDGVIKSGEWQRVETPRQKLKRLVEKGADKGQLLEAFNQLEDN